MRFTRDRRGYETTALVSNRGRRGKGPQRLLYWFRTPPGVKVGRGAIDEDAIRLLEQHNPDIQFDWSQILKEPPPPVTPRKEDRRGRDRRGAPREARPAVPRPPQPAATATAHTEKGATDYTEDTEKGATEYTEYTDKGATDYTEYTDKGATEYTEYTDKGATDYTEYTEKEATEHAAAEALSEVPEAFELAELEPIEPEPIEPEPIEPEPFESEPFEPEPGEPREPREPREPSLSPAEARLGAEGLARLRGRYAEVMARISERPLDEEAREQLKQRAERLNPDSWVTADEVAEALEVYESVYDELRAVVGTRRGRRRRRGGRRSGGAGGHNQQV